MNRTATQMNLFPNTSLNPTYEVKRQLRLSLAGSTLSREQVVDQMNEIAVREGMRTSVSKATLDNWTKDSDPARLPSLPLLTIFCHVLNSVAPFQALIAPLGADVVDEENARLLMWAKAEREKRRAVRRAKIAEQALEDI